MNGNLDEMAICLKIEKDFQAKAGWNGEKIVVTYKDLVVTLRQLPRNGELFWTITGLSSPNGELDDDNYFSDYLDRLEIFALNLGDWLYREN